MSEKLDLRSQTFPLSYAKAKVTLEELNSGDELVIVLQAGEEADSVCSKLQEDGHEIVSKDGDGGVRQVRIKRK